MSTSCEGVRHKDDGRPGHRAGRAWVVDQMPSADSQRADEIDAKDTDTLAPTVGSLTVGLGAKVRASTSTAASGGL